MQEDMTTTTPERDVREPRDIVAQVYALLLGLMLLVWLIGGWNGVYFWPYLLLWLMAAAAFIASAISARKGKALPAAFLLVLGGTLVLPAGLPAVVIGWVRLWRGHRRRFLQPFATLLTGVFLAYIMMLALPARLESRPWRGAKGVLHGAWFSWVRPGNLLALMKGADYDTLRHRTLLCKCARYTCMEPVSFAALGCTGEHMREANRLLNEALKGMTPPGAMPVAVEIDREAMARDSAASRDFLLAYQEAQTNAINYVLGNTDQAAVSKRAFSKDGHALPVVVLDDAMTLERLFRWYAGILVGAGLNHPLFNEDKPLLPVTDMVLYD